jgi:hypothetical protein
MKMALILMRVMHYRLSTETLPSLYMQPFPDYYICVVHIEPRENVVVGGS